MKADADELLAKARRLRLCGLASRWDEISRDSELLACARRVLEWEDDERHRRRQAQCVRLCGVHGVAPMSSFDWASPKRVDRELIESLFTLSFLEDHTNVLILGPNGVGKTMIAKNLIDHAARGGEHALFVECAVMLDDLTRHTTTSGLERALSRYVKPTLLAIDEVGYLSYDTRHADLLFQLIQRRYQRSSTIITTNKGFNEWNAVFPNAASVTALVDRLVERCEVVQIDGASYRYKRYEERTRARQAGRRTVTRTGDR